MRRRGRPGLVGTMARTAVVAGTATAVHGAMTGGSDAEAQAANQAAAEAQAEAASLQAQLSAQQAAAPAAPAVDLTAELEKLGQMKASGILTDEEFAAAKAKLLAG